MKWFWKTLAILATVGCLVGTFLAIWLTGDFWPIRSGGSALALFFLASGLWMLEWGA